ncbi:MAG: proton-conducting transporter membrane subunit [Pseudomonadota bacterium]|nr:proton-conducting transporter membrane subunit [Pseudomonadota bacterium]
MIENLLYFSPFLILFAGALALFFCHWQDISVSWSFRLAKIFTVLGWGTSIIFYNRSALPDIMNANLFSALFSGLMFAAICATLFLSRKWYASMNMSGSAFCCGLLISAIGGMTLALSEHLLLTAAGIILLLAANYILFLHADKKKEIYLSYRLYFSLAVLVLFFLLGAVLFLFWQTNNLSYSVLGEFFTADANRISVFAAAIVLVLTFVFLLGLSPLHFWYTETAGQIILPVFTYFTLVPVGICWAAFIKLNAGVLSALEPNLSFLYQGLAVSALFIGAIGACSGKNIRKIFAYSTVYQQGLIFLMLQRLSPDALNTAFLYLVTYLLAMYGVCTCLYGLKNKGEYLFMLSDFEGASFRKPYISATLTVFLFSLIGFPPFLGFLGLFSVVSDLVLHNNFYQLFFVLTALIILAYAYLQIIKTLYFEDSNIAFDRADRGIYTAIMLIVLLMIVFMLHPHFLAQDTEEILESILRWH